jgi:hypothetical protein
VLEELSVVFAIEIVAGEPAILYQRLDVETTHRGIIFGVVTKL